MYKTGLKRLWASAALGVLLLSSANAQDLTGFWSGTMQAGGATLKIVFLVERDSSGALRAEMDSPDQGAYRMAADSVISNGKELRIYMLRGAAHYTGTWEDNSWKGIFQQTPHKFPLTLVKDTDYRRPFRPQTPEPPYPYRELPVRFENSQAGIALAGTLTMPEGQGPFPGVVLISGSGPQDRNEEILGHQPFKILADHLTRSGFAVLRYDDRGAGESEGVFATATTKDFAGDARSAYTFLQQYPRIMPDKVGLLGHSEGALIGAMLTADDPDLAFMVMLGGPAIKGADLLLLQNKKILSAAGVADTTVSKYADLLHLWFRIILKEPDNAKAMAEIRHVADNQLGLFTDEEKAVLPLNGLQMISLVQQLTSPWMRFFLAYDPRPDLSRIRVPVLALWGEKDLQVPAAENQAAMQEMLDSYLKENITMKRMESMNHLFQTCTTGEVEEYGRLEETIAPKVLNIIRNWLYPIVKQE